MLDNEETPVTLLRCANRHGRGLPRPAGRDTYKFGGRTLLCSPVTSYKNEPYQVFFCLVFIVAKVPSSMERIAMSAEPELASLTQNDKIELAKALFAVKSIASEVDYEKIRAILVGPGNARAVDQAIHGLSKEDEFAFMCQLMGTASHFVHLEQRPVIKGEFLIPDFLGRFQPGCTPHGKKSLEHNGFRCLVEVKSTRNDKFRIGGKKLRYLRAFADQFDFPLLFAVRFLRFDEYALWVIVEDETGKNSITVTYNGLTDGVRNVLWDDFMYVVYPYILFRAVYDTADGAEETGIRHERYGKQREFHIVSHPDHPISGPSVVDNAVRVTGINALTLSAFFEGFRPEEVEARKRGTVTVQTLRATVPCSVADLVYCFNRLPRDEHGRALLDPSRILSGANSDSGLITREMIDRIARDFWHSVLGVITFGEPEAQFQKWQRFGGQI
jgi:hypothetical protein